MFTHSKIKFSNKSFRNFLSSEINYSFKTISTNKEKKYKIILSLNTNKSCRLPKVLHFLHGQISNNLATICNLSFSTGIFPVIVKIDKIIPIHKKNYKLEVYNYRLILTYPILIKFLKNSFTADQKNFLKKRNALLQIVWIQKRFPHEPCHFNFARKHTESTK